MNLDRLLRSMEIFRIDKRLIIFDHQRRREAIQRSRQASYQFTDGISFREFLFDSRVDHCKTQSTVDISKNKVKSKQNKY